MIPVDKPPPELRPVGTEYWSDWGQDIHSTSPNQRRLKYRVVAHKLTWRHEKDSTPILAECIDCIAVEEKPIDFYPLEGVVYDTSK